MFHYFIEYDAISSYGRRDPQPTRANGVNGSHATSRRSRSEAGAFNVDPVLTIPKRSPILDSYSKPESNGGQVLSEVVNIPTDGLVIQSVIAKWMGSIDQWAPHLDVTRDRGYNMFHFAPLQQRGISGSPYSLYDQLAFDDALFPEGAKLPIAKRADRMKNLLAEIRTKWGILSMTDVVWNHTANNSDWLLDHPEAGYNIVNSPHLESALLLDDALMDFSNKLESLGLPTDLKSQDDLAQIMRYIIDRLLPSLKLWEFYVIDVASEKSKFIKAWGSASKSEITEDLATMPRKDLTDLFASLCFPERWTDLGGRYNAHIKNVEVAVAFVAKLLNVSSSDGSAADRASSEIERILNDLNVDRYKMFNDDVQAAIDNTKGRIDYTRLAGHGPRLGKITAE